MSEEHKVHIDEVLVCTVISFKHVDRKLVEKKCL
jgi:hypothetical protein